MKKINKKLSKEKINKIKTEVENAPLESLKTEFDRYVNTIVRYRFLDVCTSGAYFNNLHTTALRNMFEMIDSSKKSKKEKQKLMGNMLFYSNIKPTIDELRKEELKYWQSKVGHAKDFLANISESDKKKIIINCIEQTKLWSDRMTQHSKLYDKLNNKGNQSNKEQGILTQDKISADKK